jgi:hypothetical protein
MTEMNLSRAEELSTEIRDYDVCFAEFLKPADNGQKIMQSILLREAFNRFAQQRVAIKQDAPTAILDVSCGPGDFSLTWVSQIARFLPQGISFYCTDYPGGISKDTGETYATTTARKIQAAAQERRLRLARAPVAIDADLFSGNDVLMPRGQTADIVHWSHSGYHVRDTLGADKNNPRAVETGLNTAIDKMWAALDDRGLMFSVHQTGDISDGIPSQMLPVSRKYCGALDDVPDRIEKRVGQLGGYVTAVNFASPLRFPPLDDRGWEVLKRPARWGELDASQARTLRLLNFIAYDFSNPAKAALETLVEGSRFTAYVDEFKTIVENNGGYIVIKCAFQMLTKSEPVAIELAGIVHGLHGKMPDFSQEMATAMGK